MSTLQHNPSTTCLCRDALGLLLDLKPKSRILDIGRVPFFSPSLYDNFSLRSDMADCLNLNNYPDKTFDTVLWNDGFADLPENISDNATVLQKTILIEIRRILRSDGHFALAVDNCLSWHFLNKIKNSRQNCFTDLLIQSFTEILQITTRGGYNQHSTYSYWGYKRLLKKASFGTRYFHMTHPENCNPLYVLPMVAEYAPRHVRKRVFQSSFVPTRKDSRRHILRELGSMTASRNLGLYLGASFFVVASKNDNHRNPFPSIINQILEKSFEKGAHGLILMIRGTNIAVIPSYRPLRKELFYLKIPLTEYADFCLLKSWKFIEYLATEHNDVITAPKPVTSGKLYNCKYYIETALPGTSGSRLKADPDILIRRSIELIFLIHQRTRSKHVRTTISCWQNRVNEIALNESVKLCDGFDRLCEIFQRHLEELPCSVISHNDYYLENILFDNKSNITGIIDWDLADKSGIPAMDILNLIINSNKRFGALTIQNSIQQLLANSIQKHIFKDYCRQIGISTNFTDWLEMFIFVQIWKATIHQKFHKKGSQGYLNIAANIQNLIELGNTLRE